MLNLVTQREKKASFPKITQKNLETQITSLSSFAAQLYIRAQFLKFYLTRNLRESEFTQPPLIYHTSSVKYTFSQC
jgi:hypothetical protein